MVTSILDYDPFLYPQKSMKNFFNLFNVMWIISSHVGLVAAKRISDLNVFKGKRKFIENWICSSGFN